MSFRCDGLTYDQVMDGYDPTQYNDIQSLRVDTDDLYVMWKGRKMDLSYYGLKTEVSSAYDGPDMSVSMHLSFSLAQNRSFPLTTFYLLHHFS